MKIYKFSRIVAIPFAIVLLWFLYIAFVDSSSKKLVWMIIPVVFLILIYLFQPQIDFWWLEKNPITIDKSVMDLIQKLNPAYKRLSDEEKDQFRNRLLLHTEAKQFTAKGSENNTVPYDIKYILSQIPVTMSFFLEEYLLEKFERIIIYKHPFHSPRFQFSHAYETHIEDGVIIISFSHVEKGLFEPAEYYNIAWHAYAEAFVKMNGQKEYPEIKSDFWIKYETVTGFNKEAILNFLGLESIDPLFSLIVLYFDNYYGCKETYPTETDSLNKIFSFQKIVADKN